MKETGKNPRKNLENYGKNVRKDTQKNVQKAAEHTPRRTSDKQADTKRTGQVGGAYVNVPYARQLKDKQKLVEEMIGDLVEVKPITGMANPLHYRNKVHAAFARDRKGNIISGMYQEGTHRVIPSETNDIDDEISNQIIQDIKKMLKGFKITIYDEDTGYGLLRHILVKRAFATGQVMVVLVLASPILPSKNNFVKALLKQHPEVTTVIINVNDRQTSMVLGDQEKAIYGRGYIEDILCGKKFKISAKSFYQVNPVQTEILYTKAIDLAGLTGRETIVDAYCGIGTIGIIASDRAAKVVSVELNRDAVRDAVANMKANQITNMQVYGNDAGKFMVEMAAANTHVDVVFMDPPRAGSSEEFMDAVMMLAPDRVVYISCNPETLARDLKYFAKCGFAAQVAYPVDMFPNTGHVETVALLSKKA